MIAPRFAWNPSDPNGRLEQMATGRAVAAVREMIPTLASAAPVHAVLEAGVAEMASHLANSDVVNVYDFRTTSGDTDHTAALVAAASALQTRGGGTLLVPGDLRVASTEYSASLPASPLCAFSSLNGVRVIVLGDLHVDRSFADGETLTLFQFTDCKNVEVQVPYGYSAVSSDSSPARGPELVRCLGACRNVKVSATLDKFYAGVLCNAAAGAADTARTKGVVLDLTVSNGYYGFVGQFSGDQVDARIVADGMVRSYFVYGVRTQRVRVESKNNGADDCILRGYLGYGVEDVDLTYRNVGSTTAATAAPGVAIAPNVATGNTTASTFRNIRVNIHVEYGGIGGPGHAFYIYKTLDDTNLDTVDRGHVIEGLDVTLTVVGQNQGNTAYPWLLGGTWGGTNDSFRNWRVSRASVEGASNSVLLTLTSLKDRATFSNIVSSVYWELSAGSNGRITCTDCKAPALCASNADTSWIDYVNCHLTDTAKTAATNKTYVNCDNNGTRLDVLGRSSSLLSFYGGTAVAKPAVSGSRGGNAALASLLTALASQGLLTDSSSA